MRRAVLPWVAAALLLVGGSVAAIALANATVFSAGAFVRVYLDALARGDAAAAASVPGVTTGSLDRTAVANAALPTLSRIRQVADRAEADGTHRITVAWTSRGHAGRSTFAVEPDGSRLLVVPAWRFARSPVARLDVEPQGDTRFRIGRQDAVAGRGLALLVPGSYRIDMHGPIATAPAQDLRAEDPGSRLTARPDGRATRAFTVAVDRAVKAATDACAKQRALFPGGCGFGAEITDRIVSEPTWRVESYPTATVQPTATPGVWQAELDGGTAVVTVDVRSLFDGTVKTRTIDAPIDGAYRVVVDDDRPVLAGLDASG